MDQDSPEGTNDRNKLKECLARCDHLEKEKQELIVGFEDKRNKFKELYQAKEKLISEQAEELDTCREKLKQHDSTISKMSMEINDLKMIASVSENTKQEAVDNLSKRHQEEMESLRRAMEESNEESQRELCRHFERERRQWQKQIADVQHEKNALEMQLDEVQKKIAHDKQFQEEEELEMSMQKAHAEAEELKSIILPLENDIANLKKELAITKSDLEESRKLTAELRQKALKVEELTTSSECVEKNENSMEEMDHSLKCEKSSRTDLERYVEVLQEQKKQLETQRDELQASYQSIHKQYDLEKEEHSVLKQTWLAANDQFLESQRLLMRDVNIIEGVLSEDQRVQVKMLKLQAQASEAREARTATSSMALLKAKTDKFKEAATESMSQRSESDSDTQSFGSYQEFYKTEETQSLKGSSESASQEDLKIKSGDSEDGGTTASMPGPGQKIVNEDEWDKMTREIRYLRNKVARLDGGTSLSTPELKHADLFDDDAKMNAEIGTLRDEVKVYKKRETELSERCKSLEESIQFSAEDAQKQITLLADKLSDFERVVGGLREKQIKIKAEDINKMFELKKEKEKYREELFSFKKEREKLSELQERHHQTLVKETATAAKDPKMLGTMLAACRKALSDTRAEKDVLESKLRSEIAFMEERLRAEQSTRDQMETSLASELHDARGEIVALQSLKPLKDELEKLRKEKAETEVLLEKGKTSYEALQSKSNEIIKGLRKKHLAEIRAREDVETALADSKHKLKSLHNALETSELVQRDFVKLSQTLQVELEQVRQERERERKSDTESVKSLEFQNLTLDPDTDQRSPALSPDQGRKNKLEKTVLGISSNQSPEVSPEQARKKDARKTQSSHSS